MSTWLTIPSARPSVDADAVLGKWRERGYKIALWRDSEQDLPICDFLLIGEYPGYSRSVNALVREVLARDRSCMWTVTGGDDVDPDPTHQADDIAASCTEHFGGSFGIMQPVGDPWAEHSIKRICGSPWMGRDFCEQAYGGGGPMWPEYFHMFNDNELQDVATKLGCLWQREDLVHHHHHWMREGGVAPEFLERANSASNWREMEQVYLQRRRSGFPGHAPAARAS